MKSIIKIGFIGSGLNLLSGSSKPIFQLMSNMEKKGFETVMLSDQLNESISAIQEVLLEKNNLRHLKIQRADNLLKGLLYGKKEDVYIVKKWIEDCDVVITSDFLMAWLLQKNDIKSNKKLIFMASNNMNFKLKYLMNSGIPSLINICKLSFFSKLIFRNFIIRNFLNRFDYIFATSNYVKDEMNKLNLTIPIYSLPIGVESTIRYSHLNSDENIFLFFGWGSGIRGIQDVIKSFEFYNEVDSDATLKIFLQGQHGVEERYFAKKINKSKLISRINLNFFSKNLEQAILSSKAVILPFRVPFGYSQPPLAILESMAQGRVVISTNVGCIPEIISHGSDGFLVNPAKPKEISDILLKLSADMANEVGYNAFSTIQASYSWDVVIEKYVDLIKKFGD